MTRSIKFLTLTTSSAFLGNTAGVIGIGQFSVCSPAFRRNGFVTISGQNLHNVRGTELRSVQSCISKFVAKVAHVVDQSLILPAVSKSPYESPPAASPSAWS